MESLVSEGWSSGRNSFATKKFHGEEMLGEEVAPMRAEVAAAALADWAAAAFAAALPIGF